MRVEALRLSYPDEIELYKFALRLIYEDIINRPKAKKYFKTEACKKVIIEHLKWLITNL